MELTFSTIFITLVLIFLSLKLIQQKLGKSRGISTPKLPPGPWKLPVIGSMHHLIGSLPHRALTDLSRRHGPIMHLQLGEIPVIVISGPRTAKEALKTNDIALANRQKFLAAEVMTYHYQDIGYAPYGSYWRQMRKICVLELLSMKKVRSFASIREDETWTMLRSIQIQASTSNTVNLTEKVFALTNAITCRAAFGWRCKRQAELIRLTNKIMEMVSGIDVADMFPSRRIVHKLSGATSRLKMMFKSYNEILEEIIQEHREKLAETKSSSDSCSDYDDLVDVMLKINEKGDLDFPLESDNIKAVLVDMFIAGTETSGATIIWAMSEIMKHPKVLETAQAEVRKVFAGKRKIVETEDLKRLSYLIMVIKETLRLHPAIPLLLPRECREECEIEGYKIAVGTKIIINAWAINRDLEFWKDAESFKPERFMENGIDIIEPEFEYLPFGGGRRMCPGIAYSQATMVLALAQLLYHFDWKVPGGINPESLDMTEIFGASVRRKNDLCVWLQPLSFLLMSRRINKALLFLFNFPKFLNFRIVWIVSCISDLFSHI